MQGQDNIRNFVRQYYSNHSKGLKFGLYGLLGTLLLLGVFFSTTYARTLAHPTTAHTKHQNTNKLPAKADIKQPLTVAPKPEPTKAPPATPAHAAPAHVAPAAPAPIHKPVAPAPVHKPVAPAPVYKPVAPAPAPVRKPAPPVVGGSVVSMIYQVFGPYGAQAVRVATCESTLNPGATNGLAIGGSHAAGLFQILYPSTWRGTSQAGMSPYNAYANIVAAHEIFVRDGYSWREWSCRP